MEALDPRLTTDWFWPQLAGRIDDVARAGVDVDVEGLLSRAMEAGGPLPDELPAAALWWRLAGSLTPVAAEAAVDVEVSDPTEPRNVAEPSTLDLIFDAKAPAVPYNLEADLDQLRAEVSAIEEAGSRSPATSYKPDLAEGLEPSVKKIAVAIADSDMSVQPLRCDTPGETHAVLKSVAVAAANSGYRVLALPATAAAAAGPIAIATATQLLLLQKGSPNSRAGGGSPRWAPSSSSTMPTTSPTPSSRG